MVDNECSPYIYDMFVVNLNKDSNVHGRNTICTNSCSYTNKVSILELKIQKEKSK